MVDANDASEDDVANYFLKNIVSVGQRVVFFLLYIRLELSIFNMHLRILFIIGVYTYINIWLIYIYIYKLFYIIYI